MNLSSFDYESFAGWSNLTSDCKIAKYDDSCDAFSFSTPLEVYQSNCFNVSNQVITIFPKAFKVLKLISQSNILYRKDMPQKKSLKFQHHNPHLSDLNNLGKLGDIY